MLPLWPSSSTIIPGGIVGHGAHRAHDGGNAQRVGQDGGVRRAGALLADEPDDVLAIELHGQAGRELVRDDDDLLVRGDRPELGAGAAHQPVDHPELDRVEVGQALAEPSRAATTGSGARAP